MARRKAKNIIRKLYPDPENNSLLLSKFINLLMEDGKKSVAQRVVRKAFEIIKNKTNEDPYKIFETAIENIKPTIEVRSRRVGGATYQVPVEIRPERKQALAFRWLKLYSSQRKEKGMAAKLAGELMDAVNQTGACIKKKTDVFKMAEANRAFAHYRW